MKRPMLLQVQVLMLMLMLMCAGLPCHGGDCADLAQHACATASKNSPMVSAVVTSVTVESGSVVIDWETRTTEAGQPWVAAVIQAFKTELDSLGFTVTGFRSYPIRPASGTADLIACPFEFRAACPSVARGPGPDAGTAAREASRLKAAERLASIPVAVLVLSSISHPESGDAFALCLTGSDRREYRLREGSKLADGRVLRIEENRVVFVMVDGHQVSVKVPPEGSQCSGAQARSASECVNAVNQMRAEVKFLWSQVWSREGTLRLTGVATNRMSIPRIVAQLQRCPWFDAVKLVRLELTSEGYWRFSITSTCLTSTNGRKPSAGDH